MTFIKFISEFLPNLTQTQVNDIKEYLELENVENVAVSDINKFLGTFVDLATLQAAYPSPVIGSYAHVDAGVGNEVSVYIWDNDDDDYKLQASATSAETESSVKTKYESNPDTNAYTDAEKVVVGNTSNTNTGDNSANSTYSNVDNTSDANKPVSTATQTGLDGKQGSITVSDTAPVSPDDGDLWLDSTQTKLYTYYNDGNSSQWVSVNSGSSTAGSKTGWMDYNDATGSFSIAADTWTDMPNNGAGSFTNKAYKPAAVTDVIDESTGYLDFSDLPLGSEISLRNDITITPNTNNALFELRYVLGTGAGEYALNFLSERLDSGSSVAYQRVITFPIYMGDTNTKNNAGKLQARLSTPGTIQNAGVYASIQLF